MGFTTKLIRALTWPKHRAFEKACKDPQSATARLWEETKTELRNGEFWKGCVHDKLSDYPVTDYETYRDSINASYASETSSLTGRKILFWSESGGTTGQAKIYPITEEYKKSFQSTTPPFLHSLASRFSGFLSEPVLYFAATLPSEKSPAGIEKGFISGYNYRNIPPLLAKKYAFPLEVFRDRELFFRWGPLYALATDLSAMIAITPSMVEQFARALEMNLEDYWPYLEAEKPLSPETGLPPVHCSKKRAAHLRKVFKRGFPFSFKETWPGLQFICCWKTATCGLQLARIDSWTKGVPIVDATYSATEGWITVPLWTERSGGPVHPSALITEYFPAGEEPSSANIKQLWELEAGKDYEILLTTKMGFVRFRLYDVVRCTGFFHQSPILEFSEKAGNTVSLGHTRISETHILTALQAADQELPLPWIIAPAADGSGLLFHFRDDVARIAERVKELDYALQKANLEYWEDIRDKLLFPMQASKLPADHPLWNKTAHAQTKPKVIQQNPV
jgi:hypothetical protein